MQHAGDPAQDTEADVDNEISAASFLQENGDWRQEEAEEVEEDVRLGGRQD